MPEQVNDNSLPGKEAVDLGVIQRRSRLLEMHHQKKSSSNEYRSLVTQVRHDTLSRIPEYTALQERLQNPNENFEEVAALIKKVRTEFFKDPLFSYNKVRFLSTTEELEGYKKEKLAAHAEKLSRQKKIDDDIAAGNKIEPHLSLHRYDSDLSFPEYPALPQYSFQKLYHWIPTQLLERVYKQGLLPGFLAGDTPTTSRPVAHATFQRNEYWNKYMASDREDAGFSDYSDPAQYTELEIDYDPLIEAYMWPPIIDKSSNGDMMLKSDHRATSYEHSPLLSTRVVPLDSQISFLLDFDKKEAERREGEGENSDEQYNKWVYSHLLKRKVPPNSSSLPESYETSEVLLDYVLTCQNMYC